ncbi:hypothetical protein AMECASPLE_015369, partial [Ameca splendens]
VFVRLVGKRCSGWQMLVYGGVEMKFLPDNFVKAPSWGKMEKCKKADLLTVANYYDDEVTYSVRKAELKETLCKKLMEKDVHLTAQIAAVSVGVCEFSCVVFYLLLTLTHH